MKYKYTREEIVRKYGMFTGYKKYTNCILVDDLLRKAEWPQPGDKYWYVGAGGNILSQNKDRIYLDDWDKELEEFGNCFRTKKEAIKARDKIFKVLTNDHQD